MGVPEDAQLEEVPGWILGIAEVAGWAADIIGFAPGFLSGVCAGLALLLGVVSTIAYVVAALINPSYWGKALLAAGGALLNVVGGRAGKALLNHVRAGYGGKLMYMAKHGMKNSERAVRMLPSNMRIKFETMITGVSGLIGFAYSRLSDNLTAGAA